MARPRESTKIKDPEHLWALYTSYKAYVKENPIRVKDWVGKDAVPVYREKERPVTFEGFECFVWDMGVAKGIDHIFSNQLGRYKRFMAICMRIKKDIRNEQIQGGMAGIYNPSITQRLNNLVDKVQQTIVEQPLFNFDDNETEEED